jgi:hypothetical protein
MSLLGANGGDDSRLRDCDSFIFTQRVLNIL